MLILYAWQVDSQVLTVKGLSYSLKSVQPDLPYTCMSLSEHLDSSSRSCGQGPLVDTRTYTARTRNAWEHSVSCAPGQFSLSVADHIPLVLVQSFLIRNSSSARRSPLLQNHPFYLPMLEPNLSL